MSSHKQLAFFNKSGDSLNLNYNENTQLFEGSLLFDENSTDTFKTYALYTLEKVPTFDFESIGDMGTNKFQLFNEFGIHFYGSKTNVIEQIINIEPVNNDSTFYSKWIYGENFEVKFPVGTLVVFNSSLLEFTNNNQSFVVVGSKKNAIMIISTIDNSTFETTYYTEYSNPLTYINKYISSIDAIGIYNYIDIEFQKSQTAVSSSLSRLLVSVEAYPQLRANENFLRLQTELEGTENRINIARNTYNESVKIYNIHIKKFPGSLLAGVFNFKEMPYYKADEGADKAPKVNFDFSK